ncbi:MAG: metallophosphoesterase [Carboxylicivirga sp.]|jgi:predicted MPP superfamily phosphohydrolase|nr:metallophosphoesterase [Carboxylicivirga sp.]
MNFKKLTQLVSLIFILLCFTVYNHAKSLRINHGPFIQHGTNNGVTINWTTSVDCISWVEYYEDDGSNFYKEERQRVYCSSGGIKNIGMYHKVTINNLKDDTKYAYRIYSREVEGGVALNRTVATRVYQREPLYFTTLNPDKKQSSCVVLSDMHENPVKTAQLLDDVEWNNTDFVLLNGDFINNFQKEENLYSVVDTCVDIFAKEIPLYIARGNHETRGFKARNFDKYFHFPENRYYYTFSVGSTFFIVLDSGEDKPDSDIEYYGMADFDAYRDQQAEWLAGVVETEGFKKSAHRIVFMHIPPYKGSRNNSWHGELEVRKKFVPILNKAGIDLMLCGHTHRYAFIPEKTGENNFPILITDNKSKVNLSTDDKGIKAQVVNLDLQITKELFFNK